jgi:hypothetical protein
MAKLLGNGEMKRKTRYHTEDKRSISSLNGWNKENNTRVQSEGFLKDNRGIDTVALKMVLYLAITGTILLLVTVSWGNISPFFAKAQADEQIKDAAVELLSIQNGYSRNLNDATTVQGSTCIVKLSLPEKVRFLALGVDPDTNCDGNLTNSDWVAENGTILLQYYSGEKTRFLIDDDNIQFRKGIVDQNGNWNIDSLNGYSPRGVVIEEPVHGDFEFELVYDSTGIVTLSHF